VLVALHDPLLVLASFLAVFALFVGARAMAARGASPATVRRALHVATGLWTTLVSALFWRLGWALVPPLAFLAVNASGKLSRFVPSLDRSPDRSEDRSGEDAPGALRQSRTGLWTFPLGVALAYVLFWRDPPRPPIVAGCLALALADPVAAWVGRRYGQRRLRPLALHRTLEGSMAFFVVAALTTAFIAARLGVPGVAGEGVPVLRLAIGCAAAGALAEAFAPPGWDNALIPVAVGAAWLALA
jgi:phytol kinase